MYNYIQEYKLPDITSETIKYMDGDPLKLNKEFMFFHNKNSFRPELTPLQQLFNEYIKYALHCPGIRDSYLKFEYTEKYLIVLLTTMETHKETNKFIAEYDDVALEKGEFHLVSKPEYMLLLAIDMEGIKAGIRTMEEIIKQTLEDYFSQLQKNEIDDYIKIRNFEMLNSKKKE